MKCKVCNGCGEKKPLSSEFFYKKLKGFSNMCKPCTILDNRDNYNKNKHKYLEQKKKYYIENKDKIQKYRDDNRSFLSIANRKRTNLKRRKCPLTRLKKRYSDYLRISLKRRGFKKSKVSKEVIGCSWGNFIIHLEGTFELNYGLGRAFINYNEVHIDHIIPLSTCTTIEDINKLNHYTNLQLLFSEDNREKSNKLKYVIP